VLECESNLGERVLKVLVERLKTTEEIDAWPAFETVNLIVVESGFPVAI
jgi:hypothetical protein